MSKEWFILQVKANSHVRAKKNLNQQGFETFLPLHSVTSRKASKFINSTIPLFPGYMFTAFDREQSNWHKINNTYGVSRLVTFNSILKSIPTTFIDNLKMRYDSSGKLLPIKKFKEGKQVVVSQGPFTNFIAKIETYESDKRIWILMDIMGRETLVKSSSDSLRLSN